DVSQADFTGLDLRYSDFSRVEGLTWDHLKVAGRDLQGIQYPSGFDFTGADFSGREIAGSDFKHVRGLTWEQMTAQHGWKKIIGVKKSLKGIVFPCSFDYSRVTFKGMDISYSDFTGMDHRPLI
ncbi:MAG: hypothetical protein SCM88_06000, partial [Bacillota bacterium]|nr:hypothetical protein [Bacillota bacterium]